MAFTPRTETYVNVSSLTTPFNITVTKPTGTVDGDILFCWIGWYAAVTIDSVPSGWNLLGEYLANTDRYALYYKVASGEGASWVWSFSATAKVRAVCSCYIKGDFHPTTPIDVVSNTAYRTSDLNVIAATMNVAEVNSPLIFWGGFYNTSTKSFAKPSVPTSGWVEDDDVWNTTPDFGTEVCSFIWSGSGATGAMSATLSTGSTITKHAFAVALKPATVVEGVASGSGNGLSSSAPLLYALGVVVASGAGLASSPGILDILAQLQGSGVGLASSLVILDILAQASAQGDGIALAIGDVVTFEVVEGFSIGSGEGQAATQSIINIVAQVTGSGEGLSTGTAYLVVPAGVLGSGVGESSANSYLLIPASVSASGGGLAQAVADLIVLGQVLGSGIGESSADSYIIIPALMNGEGIGFGQSSSRLFIVGMPQGSGMGNGIVEALLELIATALGSGEGSGPSEALLGILAQAEASGDGLGVASGDIAAIVHIIESLASGSGIGLSSIGALINILAHVQGSGIGEVTAKTSVLVVLTREEYEVLLARIVELELPPKHKAHIVI